MMGERQVRQEASFYGFSLEEHVPADHLLRGIGCFVELSGIRRQLEPFYSATGRPSIDPELMIRMLLVGYCCGSCLRPQCGAAWPRVSAAVRASPWRPA
jgi:transposase